MTTTLAWTGTSEFIDVFEKNAVGGNVSYNWTLDGIISKTVEQVTTTETNIRYIVDKAVKYGTNNSCSATISIDQINSDGKPAANQKILKIKPGTVAEEISVTVKAILVDNDSNDSNDIFTTATFNLVVDTVVTVATVVAPPATLLGKFTPNTVKVIDIKTTKYTNSSHPTWLVKNDIRFTVSEVTGTGSTTLTINGDTGRLTINTGNTGDTVSFNVNVHCATMPKKTVNYSIAVGQQITWSTPRFLGVYNKNTLNNSANIVAVPTSGTVTYTAVITNAKYYSTVVKQWTNVPINQVKTSVVSIANDTLSFNTGYQAEVVEITVTAKTNDDTIAEKIFVISVATLIWEDYYDTLNSAHRLPTMVKYGSQTPTFKASYIPGNQVTYTWSIANEEASKGTSFTLTNKNITVSGVTVNVADMEIHAGNSPAVTRFIVTASATDGTNNPIAISQVFEVETLPTLDIVTPSNLGAYDKNIAPVIIPLAINCDSGQGLTATISTTEYTGTGSSIDPIYPTRTVRIINAGNANQYIQTSFGTAIRVIKASDWTVLNPKFNLELITGNVEENLSFTITAATATGYSTTGSYTIKVQPAVEWVTPAGSVGVVRFGDSYQFLASCDDTSKTITYSISSAPIDWTFTSTGQLSVPSYYSNYDTKTYTFVVTAEITSGTNVISVAREFSITLADYAFSWVQPAAGLQALSWTESKTNRIDAIASSTLDNSTIKYRATDLPHGLTITESGVISGTINLISLQDSKDFYFKVHAELYSDSILRNTITREIGITVNPWLKWITPAGDLGTYAAGTLLDKNAIEASFPRRTATNNSPFHHIDYVLEYSEDTASSNNNFIQGLPSGVTFSTTDVVVDDSITQQKGKIYGIPNVSDDNKLYKFKVTAYGKNFSGMIIDTISRDFSLTIGAWVKPANSFVGNVNKGLNIPTLDFIVSPGYTGGTRWVAIANGTDKVATSLDGNSWKLSENRLPGNNYVDVATGNGVWIAVPANGNTFARSTDGSTWTTVTVPESTAWTKVAYGGGRWIAITGTVIAVVSTDNGLTWTKITLPSAIIHSAFSSTTISTSWRVLKYLNGYWVGLANGSKYCIISSNATDWKIVNTNIAKQWTDIETDGSRWVAIATGSSTVMTSSDTGNTWSEVQLPAFQWWNKVIYTGQQWLIIGTSTLTIGATTTATDTDIACYSIDGTIWQTVALPSRGQWIDITSDASRVFMISETSNKTATLTAGAEWISTTLPDIQTAKWSAITCDRALIELDVRYSISGQDFLRLATVNNVTYNGIKYSKVAQVTSSNTPLVTEDTEYPFTISYTKINPITEKTVASGSRVFTFKVLNKTIPQWDETASAITRTFTEGEVFSSSNSVVFVAKPSALGDQLTYSLLNGNLPAGNISLVQGPNNTAFLSGKLSQVSTTTSSSFTIRATETFQNTVVGTSDFPFTMIVNDRAVNPTPAFSLKQGALANNNSQANILSVATDPSTGYITITTDAAHGISSNTAIFMSGAQGSVDFFNNNLFYAGDVTSDTITLYTAAGANNQPAQPYVVDASSRDTLTHVTGTGTIAAMMLDSTYYEAKIDIEIDPDSTVTFEITNGSLPDGLELITSTGVIRGYPTGVRTVRSVTGALEYYGAVNSDGSSYFKILPVEITATTVNSTGVIKSNKAEYAIGVVNQEFLWANKQRINGTSNPFPGRLPTLLNRRPKSAEILTSDPYYSYYYSDVANKFGKYSIGKFEHNNQFLFKFNGYNFNTADSLLPESGLVYTITGMSAGTNDIDSVTNTSNVFVTNEMISPTGSPSIAHNGWVNGMLQDLSGGLRNYDFTVSLSAPSTITKITTTAKTVAGSSKLIVDDTGDDVFGFRTGQKVIFDHNIGNEIVAGSEYVISTVQPSYKSWPKLSVYTGGSIISLVQESLDGLTAGQSIRILSNTNDTATTKAATNTLYQVAGAYEMTTGISADVIAGNYITVATDSQIEVGCIIKLDITARLLAVTSINDVVVAGKRRLTVTSLLSPTFTHVPTTGLTVTLYPRIAIKERNSTDATLKTFGSTMPNTIEYEANLITISNIQRFTETTSVTMSSTDIARLTAPIESLTMTVASLKNSSVSSSTADTSNLGSINNGELSQLVVKATFGSSIADGVFTIVPVTDLDDIPASIRSYKQGLPPNLRLLSTGDIIGRVAFEQESSFLTENSSKNYCFQVKAYSKSHPEINNIQWYTLTVVHKFTEPYDNIYVNGMVDSHKRDYIDKLFEIFDATTGGTVAISNGTRPEKYSDYIYRSSDPYFGLNKQIKYGHMYGVKTRKQSIIYDTFNEAILKNHSFKNLTLKAPKRAIARDNSGTLLYEVIYSEIKDTIENESGTSISKEIVWSQPVKVSGQVSTPVIYPNSLQNMRQQIKDSVGIIDDSSLLPTWMITQQEDGNVLGYVPCWVIGYFKPGKGALVLDKINQYLSTAGSLNQINFAMDRLIIDRAQTYSYGITGNDSWTTYSAIIGAGNDQITVDIAGAIATNNPVALFTIDGSDSLGNIANGSEYYVSDIYTQKTTDINLPIAGVAGGNTLYSPVTTETAALSAGYQLSMSVENTIVQNIDDFIANAKVTGSNTSGSILTLSPIAGNSLDNLSQGDIVYFAPKTGYTNTGSTLTVNTAYYIETLSISGGITTIQIKTFAGRNQGTQVITLNNNNEYQLQRKTVVVNNVLPVDFNTVVRSFKYATKVTLRANAKSVTDKFTPTESGVMTLRTVPLSQSSMDDTKDAYIIFPRNYE